MRHDQLGERDWRSDNCFKFIFSPLGSGKYQTAYGEIAINQNTFFIFNPNDRHKQLVTEHEKFLVELQPTILYEAAQQLNIKQSYLEFSTVAYKHPQIENWVHFVRHFLMCNKESNTSVNQLFLDNSLIQLAILILLYGTGSHQNSFPSTAVKSNINATIDALKQSYTDPWTLDQMAAIAGINKFQFVHQFKEEVGLSPYSWLQLYRLFRSQYALLHTNEQIITIALQHGFQNVSSYNQLFKKVYRRTPTTFRALYRRQN